MGGFVAKVECTTAIPIFEGIYHINIRPILSSGISNLFCGLFWQSYYTRGNTFPSVVFVSQEAGIAIGVILEEYLVESCCHTHVVDSYQRARLAKCFDGMVVLQLQKPSKSIQGFSSMK